MPKVSYILTLNSSDDPSHEAQDIFDSLTGDHFNVISVNPWARPDAMVAGQQPDSSNPPEVGPLSLY